MILQARKKIRKERKGLKKILGQLAKEGRAPASTSKKEKTRHK